MNFHLPTVVDPWLWPAFICGVLFLVLLDLFVLHRKAEVMNHKEALLWTGIWTVISLTFSGWFAHEYGSALGLQFLTGYVVEQSLSIDNLFVILLIFKSFRIPQRNQHRVLFWGIMGAIVFRGILIIVGVDLLHKFSWLMYVFGAVLIFTGLKFLFESDEEKGVEDSIAVRWARRILPTTEGLHGEHFFVVENAVRKATPLFLALVVIEISDIIFAVDSIPAVLAVTQDAFVAFGSNILAVLGLRALYFVIAGWVGHLRYLKPGLAVILCFVGAKMIAADWYHIPSWVSLAVIIGVLVTAALTSWYVARNDSGVR